MDGSFEMPSLSVKIIIYGFQLRCHMLLKRSQCRCKSRCTSTNEKKSIYVDWNGKDDRGNDLATVIYYYHAAITFDVIAPAKGQKK